MSAAVQPTPANNSYSWIQMVADTVARFDDAPENRMTTWSQPCVIKGSPSVVYARGLHESCSTLFHYLQNFAFCNDLKLVEDRRVDRMKVTNDRRKSWAPVVALGAGMMLRDTPFDGASLIPSTPHELRSGEPELSAPELIALAAEVRVSGSYQELASNGMLIPKNSTDYSIAHYHAETEMLGQRRPVSYFEGKTFHAVGYRSGDQVVLQVLVGGGPFSAPRLWGPVQRMARDPVELHYLQGLDGRDGFGIFKVTYYLDSDGPALAQYR
ncbi:MAG: DUF3579 domain-containing protein [Pseudomonadota bacterium]